MEWKEGREERRVGLRIGGVLKKHALINRVHDDRYLRPSLSLFLLFFLRHLLRTHLSGNPIG